MQKKETILVTSALPYANGPIHFGHIAGAYLPADIFVRYKRLTQADILYICGTDEHGFAITVSAKKEGNTPKAHVDHYHNVIKDIFKKFYISFDNFSRTSMEHHYKLSQEFFTSVLKNGRISKKETDQLFCESCDIFLADRYVQGTCNFCGYEEARGDECPGCGKWTEATQLKNPKCKVCSSTPVKKKTTHWFLDLGKYTEELKAWIGSKKNWKPNVTNFIGSMIDQGLESRPITRDMQWGIPVPLKEAEGKVLYVWFDAPIGYISSTMEWAQKQGTPDRWKEYWHNPDCRLVHFIGKDNLPFHCITWPAVLMKQDEPYILPTDVPANEFYNLEGKQFSKSTGWYIDIEDFFSKYQTDSIRYVIAANAPETKDSAFSWQDFQNRHNGELADILGNLVNRVLKFTASNFDNKVPSRGTPGASDLAMLEKINAAFGLVENLYDTYQVRRAAFEVMDLARFGNKYFDEKAPWKAKKENLADCGTTCNISIHLIKSLAQLFYPIIPDTAQKIWKMLECSGEITQINWHEEKYLAIPEGHKLGTAIVLFKKIEDEAIQLEQEKLRLLTDSRQSSRPLKPAENNLIDFEEFGKIKLKIARILTAEPVKSSKKLLCLEVDLGNEKRRIVAGIKEQYPDAAALIGRDIVVVANLKPAKLMGVESQGMLLAAKGTDGLFILSPDTGAKPGDDVG